MGINPLYLSCFLTCPMVGTTVFKSYKLYRDIINVKWRSLWALDMEHVGIQNARRINCGDSWQYQQYGPSTIICYLGTQYWKHSCKQWLYLATQKTWMFFPDTDSEFSFPGFVCVSNLFDNFGGIIGTNTYLNAPWVLSCLAAHSSFRILNSTQCFYLLFVWG